MSQHIQSAFDQHLNDIRDHIAGMAEMVLQELDDTLSALAERDESHAKDNLQSDVLINASERIIDNEVVRAIVLHQPMASDCRQLIAALRISKELERIGDYAMNVTRHSITLDQLDPTGEESRLLDMGHAVQTMLAEALQAYTALDQEKAQLIREQDEAVDELYSRIFEDLIDLNREKPEFSAACAHQKMIARCFERIGDHVTDIAEDVLYVVRGEFVEDDRPKADTSATVGV
jgi:phosphate transport system protein